MKRWSMILLLAWAAQFSAVSARETTSATPAAAPAPGASEATLEFHFHDAQLSQILDYLSREAGFIVVSDEAASPQRITLESQGALTRQQALDLLNAALASSGQAARLNGRELTIGSAADIAGGPEIKASRAWEEIPDDDHLVTQVIGLSSLDAATLAQELATLMPEGAKLSVSESGKALLMTARQADARRFAHIVQLLDHTADAAVAVFPMAHGDAKAVADELKDVFGSADSSVNTTARNASMAVAPRSSRARTDSGNAPTTHEKNGGAAPVFTSDETLNAVVAAASPDLMETIRGVIAKLDAPTDELTMARIFPLKHANATDMAQELSTLFGTPDSTGTDSRNAGPIFALGTRGVQALDAGGGGQSRRALKQAQVTAVADSRTQSVMVTASKTAMENIAGIVHSLDASSAQAEVVTSFDLSQVDPGDASDALQAMFASAQSAQTVVSPLKDRATAAANQQSATAATSFGQSSSLGASR